ncbi:hypothetical protein F5Y15DRAFT_250248 [Xylariaceae sp. FL0016]|nr:hypothetical protein F5Y15DRAFT_250248 [Xylariaceae sp. FL0016]
MLPPPKNMLSSLLRPKSQATRPNTRLFASNPNSPSPGPTSRNRSDQRHATADFTEVDDEDEDDEEYDDFDFGEPSVPRVTRFAEQDDGGRTHSSSVIPLFSSDYLDSLPVYNVVHAIRIIVQTRTETSLSWDQLRSPQVSQFLIKPMQSQIRTQHFTRVTLYALMANSLQFTKEGQLYPGNMGVSSTRALVCELLALKLLKDYNTRELIDALSYDFDPLQGAPELPGARPNTARARAAVARSSTLEVAIRASAKRFLAHPLVVQQLEAIWNGAISFYSSHDSLHRMSLPISDPGSDRQGRVDARTPLLGHQHAKEQMDRLPFHAIPVRRTVTLYDPRNASLMKLSRLRVPRYRQFFSTCSLFILICLFLAVLIERSAKITSLELVFWFWSAGFMLDEVVGFNEQGFSLYIMSFWNIFDLGILLLLIIYYCMRVYGVFLVEPRQWNEMAYDVLAANAVFLVPRIFSVLDHYQYFSQLLIAFRLMAVDLMAVFVLVLISCSGFFVFFTLSRNSNEGPEVAYKIFQILMGFSPAAWDVWPEYNYMGRLLLVIFMVISHFIVITILITVMTNSFMKIATNAREEHQFLFAINTFSMVKNDALFSYVAPANIFAWLLMPCRYIMPIRQFVILNRYVIKLTHWPLLFSIFVYEKYVLASTIYEPTDLVDNPGKGKHRGVSFADPASRSVLFSPGVRTREESVAGLQKDRALDEVFRRGHVTNSMRNQRRQERKKTQTAIRNWMEQNDDEIGERLSHWPTIDSRPSLSVRRMSMSRDMPRKFRQISDVRSAASDPADLVSNIGFPHTNMSELHGQIVEQQNKDQPDADGDDELVTNDEDDEDDMAGESRQDHESHNGNEEDYFTTPMASKREIAAPSPINSSVPRQLASSSPRNGGVLRRQGLHNRTLSTNTILFNPQAQETSRHGPSPSSISEQPFGARSRPRTSRLITTIEQSAPTGTRSPRRTQYVTTPARPKPIPMKSAPNRIALHTIDPRRKASSIDIDINSDMGLDANNDFGAVPASFATQMAMATGQLMGGRTSSDRENADRMSRLVLARMKTLEESFADVVREMRVTRSMAPTAQNSGDDGSWHDDTPGPVVQQAGARSRPATKGKSSRPGSIRGDRAELSGAMSPRKQHDRDRDRAKGKGKVVPRSTGTETESNDEMEERRLARRGSSF